MPGLCRTVSETRGIDKQAGHLSPTIHQTVTNTLPNHSLSTALQLPWLVLRLPLHHGTEKTFWGKCSGIILGPVMALVMQKATWNTVAKNETAISKYINICVGNVSFNGWYIALSVIYFSFHSSRNVFSQWVGLHLEICLEFGLVVTSVDTLAKWNWGEIKALCALGPAGLSHSRVFLSKQTSKATCSGQK